MDRLAVTVSEGKLHEVEAPDAFETDGPFVVAVSNRGRDCHVHLRLDDDLSRVATLAETNPHVPRDETVEILADVQGVSTPVGGVLTVETGYGADGADVETTLNPPDTTTAAAARTTPGTHAPADDQTADDAETDDAGDESATPTVADALPTSRPTLPTVALLLLALGVVGVAVGTAAVVADPVVAVGAGVALVAVAVAAVLVAR